jgi:ATP-dependent Clp protease ATP-binding subunit ClpA
LTSTNSTIAGLLLAGAEPSLAAAGLSDLVSDNLSVTLDAPAIERLLGDYGLQLRPITGSPTIGQGIRSLSASWAESIRRELLQPAIQRSEAGTIADHLMHDLGRPLFVVGDAGSGKSAVLHQVVGRIDQRACATPTYVGR